MNLLFFAASACYADIYKFTDSEGVIHLTNIPTEHDAPYVVVMKEKSVIVPLKGDTAGNKQLKEDMAGNDQLKGDITGYDDLIAKVSTKYSIDSSLVKAVIKAESNFNHLAVSPVGAQGLMQLMPSTAASLQVQDAFHPETNIDGGVRYLRYLMNLFSGNLPLVLAAYNAGENAVLQYNNRIPPYRETQTYVKRVLNLFDQYSRRNGPH